MHGQRVMPMKAADAIVALGALAQDSRLALYRLLLKQGSEGCPAGEIARRVGLPAASNSFHIKELTRAGLLIARREGRFVYYRANSARMDQVLQYLAENCCVGGTYASADGAADPLARSRRRKRT
jgi:DNA-binding transcriptional ArsR family regulator